MITYIHSATVLVQDQDRAVDFYVDTLGFEKRDDRPYGDSPDASRWIVIAPPGAETALALVRPQDAGLGEDAAGGSRGISLIADDVNATYEELSAKGVTFSAKPERMPWGALATWFADPDGNTFFLTEQG